MNNGLITANSGSEDIDPTETQEWIESLEAVLREEGGERAHFLIEQLVALARQSGADIPFSAHTAYINTIPVEQQLQFPGDTTIEHKIRQRLAQFSLTYAGWPKKQEGTIRPTGIRQTSA